MNLKHKVVVITGGAKGLGYALAETFASRGASVAICDIDENQLNTAGEKLNGLRGSGGSSANSMTCSVDVTQEESIRAAADKVVSKFGRIDIWINNAGVWLPKDSIENINLEKAQKLFQVNVFGTIHGMRAASRVMGSGQSVLPQSKGGAEHFGNENVGSIVNIISTTAFDGMNGSSGSMYVASKYALRGLTNTVREELKERGIQVFAVYPGGMKTDIFKERKPEHIDEFMSPESVALKIVENFELENPEADLILKRPV